MYIEGQYYGFQLADQKLVLPIKSSNQLNLVLTKQNQKFSPDFANLEAVVSPTDKGFMLIRILVTDSSPETLKKYKTWQQSVKLETIESPVKD